MSFLPWIFPKWESVWCTSLAKQGEIDEMDFLFNDFSSLASPRFSPSSFVHAAKNMHRGSAGGSGASLPVVPFPSSSPSMTAPPVTVVRSPHTKQLGPGAFIKSPSVSGLMVAPLGLQSPLPMGHLVATGGPAYTPLTETMAAAAWLRGILSRISAEVRETMARTFIIIKYLGEIPPF